MSEKILRVGTCFEVHNKNYNPCFWNGKGFTSKYINTADPHHLGHGIYEYNLGSLSPKILESESLRSNLDKKGVHNLGKT